MFDIFDRKLSIDELDWESLGPDDYDLKFFTWSRKIEEHLEYLEGGWNISDEEICYYLEKCAFLREKFLDPNDLTKLEIYYMEKIQPIWEKYKRTDPVFAKFSKK